MDYIKHDYIEIKGLKLHIAEIGSGLPFFSSFLPLYFIPINFLSPNLTKSSFFIDLAIRFKDEAP